MKDKRNHAVSAGVQDLCRRLKLQLEELGVNLEATLPTTRGPEEKARRLKLMEQLKQQLGELSR